MKFWFITDTPRVAKERAAVERLATEGDWFSLQRWRLFEGRLCAEGIIRVRGADYPVRLIYPDQFPQVPAWVEPQDSQAKWSHHQYGPGGTLCLELRPDTWEETATGADVILSAFRLLDIENPLGEGGDRGRAPSGANIGAIQSYAWFLNPLFISAGCAERVQTGVASELQCAHSAYLDEIFPIFVHDQTDRALAQHPATGGRGFSEMPVWVVSHAAPDEGPSSRSDLISAAQLSDDAATHLAAAQFAVVLFAGGERLVGYQVIGDAAPIRLDVQLVPDNGGYRSGRGVGSVTKRVAIVGAGSAGSKLAECLLRSGVHRLTIVDGDVLLPANLERHTLDWRDVGYRKVKALKRRLLSIVPGADVKEIAANLNWQRSARTHAWQVEALAGCDIIVDATGDVPTTLFLGAVAAANGRPFVSIEVFEGGIGALVASCLPERDPAYGRARAAFVSWCEQQGVIAPKASSRPYESLSDEGIPLVADDTAVTMAAGHGARVVLDIVDGKPAAHDAAWMLVGFAKAWIFDGHGHVIRLSVGAPEKGGDSLVDEKALAFAAALVEEALSESTSSK